MSSAAAKTAPQTKPALRIKRKFRRHYVACEAVLAFPHQNAKPRIKAHLFQIGEGGCAVSTEDKPFIGERCIVWALGAGQRYLGIRGKIVWAKPVYENEKAQNGMLVGIQFDSPIRLTEELLAHLRQKA